jgi:23S rRNA pseudouridine2605 synthase
MNARNSQRKSKIKYSQHVHSLPRLLSKAGLASRSEAETFIREGRVWVNGNPVTDPKRRFSLNAKLELKTQSGTTTKRFSQKKFFYVLMNKPQGLVTTSKDERGRPTVYDVLRPFLKEEGITENLFAVGRLDKDTTGLLLFTNDLQLADHLTRPDSQTPKTYEAVLRQAISDAAIEQIRNGLEIIVNGKPYKTQRCDVKRIAENKVELTLTEGKNREVRKLIQAVGNEVTALHRTKFATFTLADLRGKTMAVKA